VSYDHDELRVTRAELADRPGFTGVTLRPDGRLGIFIRGRGYFVGPMTPDQLRDLAERALATADLLEARAEAAGEQALGELERIVVAGHG